MSLQGAITKYICLRDNNTAIQKEADAQIAKNKVEMEEIERCLHKVLDMNGANSLSTDAGTFYKEIDVLPRAVDWNLVYDWIKENDGFDLLEKRLTKTFIKKYLDENEEPPPGVAVQREYKVKVRRK